jgi:hypothetical protein
MRSLETRKKETVQLTVFSKVFTRLGLRNLREVFFRAQELDAICILRVFCVVLAIEVVRFEVGVRVYGFTNHASLNTGAR